MPMRRFPFDLVTRLPPRRTVDSMTKSIANFIVWFEQSFFLLPAFPLFDLQTNKKMLFALFISPPPNDIHVPDTFMCTGNGYVNGTWREFMFAHSAGHEFFNVDLPDGCAKLQSLMPAFWPELWWVTLMGLSSSQCLLVTSAKVFDKELPYNDLLF